VDDDESVRVATESLASAEEFLAVDRLKGVHCLILDIKLSGMDGLALQGRLLRPICSSPLFSSPRIGARRKEVR
jgi:FixJ family two-component response regulator